MISIDVIASGSKGNAYRISNGETALLLEAGIPWKEIQRGLGFNTSEIAGCLVSHNHKDHSKAVKEVMKAGIDVYMSKGTQEEIGALGHRLHIAAAHKQFAIGSWTIRPFDTVHDCAEPLGFLLASSTGDKLLYLTDSAYCKYRFDGVTNFMVEINFDRKTIAENVENGTIPLELKNRIIQTHFSLENAVDFFKANDLSKTREILILHLSNDNANEALIRKTIQGITGKPVIIA